MRDRRIKPRSGASHGQGGALVQVREGNYAPWSLPSTRRLRMTGPALGSCRRRVVARRRRRRSSGDGKTTEPTRGAHGGSARRAAGAHPAAASGQP